MAGAIRSACIAAGFPGNFSTHDLFKDGLMIWQWEHPQAFWWLLLIPASMTIAWQAYRSREAMWKRAAGAGLLRTWRPFSQRRFSLLLLLLVTTIFFLVLAYANPQGGNKEAKGYSRNQNVVIAMDLSQSMKASDVTPDRLERAKLFAYDVLERLQGQRVALVVFAGNAYLHLPLTTDYAACVLFISNITPEMIPTPGTAIAGALDRSLTAIKSGGFSGASSSVVLITDGEDHDNGALAMAGKLKKEGITLFTVGAGTVKGGPVPEQNGQGMKKEAGGKLVISQLNEAFLRKLAEKGIGKYFNTSSGKKAARELASEINKVASGKEERATFSVHKEWYGIFLAVVILLLIASFFMQERLIKVKDDVA